MTFLEPTDRPAEMPSTRASVRDSVVRRSLARVAREAATLVCALCVAASLQGCETDETATEPADGRVSIDLSDCTLVGDQTGRHVAARCGTLSVPENRATGVGRQIDLKVAVIPAISRSPSPDPVFLLAGGPGQAATETFPDLLHAFERLGQDRDIVLLDQRGTGGSHPLGCPALDEDTSPDDTAAIEQWARSCAIELSESADLTQYTTEAAVADLEDVRAALGYESVNLYGGSYGTRLALAYMRRHPDRVRTAVLDSVVPPDLALGTTVARDAQAALDRFFDRCEQDAACATAFPDLRGDFRTVMDRLSDGPLEVEIADPHTGEARTIPLSAQAVAGTLRFLSYSPETSSLIPLLVHTAAEDGDMRQLAAQVAMLGGAASSLVHIGLHFSVVCAEDVPFFDADDVRLHNADTYLADLLTDQLELVCGVWPRGAIPDDFKLPVAVDVPTLVLSGEDDPVTPPEYGDAVARTLPNSLHLVGPGQGHGVVVRGCVPRLVREFVKAGSVEGIDAACVAELAAAPFFLDPTGPEASPAPPRETEARELGEPATEAP